MAGQWLEIIALPECADALRGSVTEEEWCAAQTMSPPSRRIEWLAWRAVVREKLGRGTVISYDPYGAPVLEEGRGFIGVSHTKGMAAVVWSEGRCAVDIEPLSRDVSRVWTRFVSQSERALDDFRDPRFAISAWCAKEALYKYWRTPGLDFFDDIRIISSDLAAGRMAGRVKDGECVDIGIIFRDGFVVAVVFGDPARL